jgi:hypothetical protein
MEIIIIAIILSTLISLYSLMMALKAIKSIAWILRHVHVVSKSQQNDPELKQIKNTFGVKEEEEPGK